MRILDESQIIINPGTLKKIGMVIIANIQKRTESGIDADGKPFKAYSTKTFAMPSGAITKRAQKILVKDGNLQYFNTKGGSLWAVIIGGYAVLKKAVYAKTSSNGTVNLMATGAMMRSLRVQSTGNNSITLGFANTESANKAYYNKVMGREFLGLSPDDLNDSDIKRMLASGIIFK